MELTLIKRDGQTVGVADAAPQGVGLIAWFHRQHGGFSMGHALAHEGYSVQPVDGIDCRDVTPIIEAICARAGVTMSAEFVPFSRSRNAAPQHDSKPWLSLNWKVTLKRGGRDILTTDYAQGTGHAPSAKLRPPSKMSPRYLDGWRKRAAEMECETGRKTEREFVGDGLRTSRHPIDAPRLGEVMHSLILDSNVLDAGGFDAWAAELGYDTDSRKAESTYKACIDIATRLRAGLGGDLLAELALVAQFN